ncbi:prominin-like protein isoform X2 [Coccinella septempunctata]|uniref:prominin-like protein isoform X2 n=1 Tax=Coccinella septempunctata TaxID=41139 RepID=UPI001D07F352|nr:prominin-like protein isoform X2 [Coccinella septempunctata]
MANVRNNSESHQRGDGSTRRSIGFYSFLLTCLVLLLAVGVSSNDNGDHFIRKLNKIGESLDKALSSAMDLKEPNYTKIDINVTYASISRYNPRGLGELYNITKIFMGTILREALPRNVFSIQNNSLRVNLEDKVLDLIVQYSIVILICLVVVLLGAIMPVCGLFFCCCRCCGRCGARSRPYDKKHDLCRRIYLATLLIICGTLLLFGVVCAFVTNARLQDGIENLPQDIRTSVRDTDKFLNKTNSQIDILLKKNFQEFSRSIKESLDECSDIVFNELEQISNATSMDDIKNIADQFPHIRNDYELLKNSTDELRIYASQLNDAVRRIKRDLLALLKDCVGKLEQCNTLNNDIAKLQTNVDFDKLPDINAQIRELDEIVDNTNWEEISRGKEKLEKIQRDIRKAVKNNTDIAYGKIEEAGRMIAKNADKITSTVNKLRRELHEIDRGRNGQDSVLDVAQMYIDQFDPYRQYVSLSICFILLAVTLFVSLGLICGICGKRPGGYGDDCCNKGSGSQFLLCGVVFMFFFTCVIAAATLIYLLVGTVTQEAACKSFRNPASSELFRLIDQVDLKDHGLNGKVSRIIERCHRNQTLYRAFDLKRTFDVGQIKKYISDFDIENALNELNRTTSSIDFHDVVLLRPKQLNTLREIAESEFANVDFNKFLDELSANFTNVDLKIITEELEAAKRRVHDIAQTDPSAVNLERGLDSVMVQLNFYERNVVKPMQATADRVRVTASSLDTKLRLGHSSFKEGMTDLITKVQQAQNSLKYEGPKMIRQAAADFAQKILDQVEKYMDRVINKTENEVGQCGPLSNVYNATLTTVCDKIALQMNGFWFTLLCSMLVFLPTIVISVKLAILYQKQVPFSDYYIETEYLYAANDNIPLNSGRGGKDKRKKKTKRREDRTQLTQRTGNPELVPRDVVATPSGDARNWEEFPAGGPPQYQRAPTEYERPPPYYYPGTTTEQP